MSFSQDSGATFLHCLKQWIFIRGEEQKVISTGLYAIVRNPMYIGVLIMYIPTPIALGSYWGLIPFALLPVFLALRILNEEKVLSDNLKGYKEYCQRTRYRLIPYIW